MKKTVLALLLSLSLSTVNAGAQDRLTREQILSMTTDELSELPLEDLMAAVETLGVSSVDELFALIMNKNVSSASKEEESSFTSPLSSTVITREEMRTYGVSTIEEALRLVPGMIVTEKTNGVYDIQMRGLNNIPNNNMLLYTENSNTLVMVDGRPVHDYTMGAVMLEMLPIDIEDVNRIEVVRGATSALYGANAVQGVINIITEKPDASENTVSGSLQMGNLNTNIANIALRKAINDKWSVGATASVQYRNRPTSDIYVIPSSDLFLLNGQIESGTSLTNAEVQELRANGTLTAFAGGYLSADKLGDLRELRMQSSETGGASAPDAGGAKPDEGDAEGEGGAGSIGGDANATYKIYRCVEPQTPNNRTFANPALARRNINFNGYVTFKPAEGIRFDLSGGYQQSYVNTTTITDDFYSFNGRESKSGYVALAANIKNLSVLLNYTGGPRDYSVGTPGLKVFANQFNGSVEYTFEVGKVDIRPGVSYQQVYYKDYVPDYIDAEQGYDWAYYDHDDYADTDKESHLSGLFNYHAVMGAIAPSVRVDAKLGDLRLIGAFRNDKTNIPDKWNPSWQFSASYKFNDRNFIRFVYGRANRSATLLNTNANYTWTRTELSDPNELTFLNNKEANLMSIDNFELGYRWQPSNRILLDGEVFMSKSRDFGALMAQSAYLSLPMATVQSLMADGGSGAIGVDPTAITSQLVSHATIQYNTLPYEARQFGISLNLDYIISAKLVAKLNLNYQKTLIDNYYPYSQTNSLKNIIQVASSSLTSAVQETMSQIATLKANLNAKLQSGEITEDEYKQQYSAHLGSLINGGGSEGGNSFGTMNSKTNCLDMATQKAMESVFPEVDGFESKATPSFYGMIGLIYKPIQQLNISAFGNYIGKRSYITKYNSNYVDLPPEVVKALTSYDENGEDLCQRFTLNMKIGYKPTEKVEVYVNAHNLFNNKKREFVYSDEIGGLYTIGVNFGF